ncbi:MAG: S-layer homology domain-containing protein [Oscillospiraceae bacterium]|nr:S-layer homology domain-containing protein [Oscillospiraceae bacterium]
MKRWIVIFGIVVLAVVLGVAAVSYGGTAADPLISESYLEGTYQPELMSRIEGQIDTALEDVYESVLAQAGDLRPTSEDERDDAYYSDVFRDLRFKKGDEISGSLGAGFLLLAGSAQFRFDSGAVIDVSQGEEAASGAALLTDHRYMVAEDTRATVLITSDTAVLSVNGYYSTTLSSETDYNALADALKELGLFRGSDTPYGSGYALEEQPTRIQGLVMFLRLLGEEEAALACTEENPFVDTDPWCEPYLAYAYAKGYTNGTDLSRGIFSPSEPITAAQYLTFLLRALGYSDDGSEEADFTWDQALTAAFRFGVLTSEERKMLDSTTFTRAQMVYVSWFGLQARCKGTSGTTAMQQLIDSGAVTADAVARVQNSLNVSRL